MHKIWMRDYHVEDALRIPEVLNEKGFREHPDYEKWAVYFKDSLFALTFGHDGEILACSGLYKVADENVQIWLILSRAAEKYKKELTVYSKRVVDAWQRDGKFKRVQCTVEAENEVAVRFAQFIGFEIEGRMRYYGPYGRDHYMMARVRE